MYSSFTANPKAIGSQDGNLTALTTSSKQVDLGFERFESVTTGANQFPSDGSHGDLEQTGITQASLVRPSDEGRMQLGHFSHTQMENQNAPQGETARGAYGQQLSTTGADTSSLSSSTTADIVFPNSTNSPAVDGTGVSRRFSKQSLAAIFGSILGASVFAGCIVVLHKLCYRNFQSTGVQRQPTHGTCRGGRESKRSGIPHLEISRFSKDS
jgi:hypothetical protein